MKATKSNSKISTANGSSSTTPKKVSATKRAHTKTASANGARTLLSSAAPYALPGAGVLAAAALAATGFVLRKDIASFASDKAETGVEEMLRMLHLERRSSHMFGALGFFAGGIALGCLAGLVFVVPRLARMSTDAPSDVTHGDKNSVAQEPPRANSVISHSS